ncbi:hypothetical protein Rsub_07650 [Raphidocelis subcapitata]|uniref:EGF-like domain-containing protein n=1 Tax=Raphidocelis subcapitata TaxID=307507 RepID=A0A2V0PC65_9CHLO|nr:hypothetical protein Rsub_07650 [Raphidocelis subcapitata]|eukprot:GBF94767.1 hypothetical protein Rsub_07650 [Raphidocelis subcapitata]
MKLFAFLAVFAAALLVPAAAAKPKPLVTAKAVFMGGRRASAPPPATLDQPALFAAVTIYKDAKVYSAFLTPAKRFVQKSGLFKKKALETQLVSAQLVGSCAGLKVCRASFVPLKAKYSRDQFSFSLKSAPEMISSTGAKLGPLKGGALSIDGANTELVWENVEVDPCWTLDCEDPLARPPVNASAAQWSAASGAAGALLGPDGRLFLRQPGLAAFDLNAGSKLPGALYGHALCARINNYLKANKPGAQLMSMELRKNGAPKLATAAAIDVKLLGCGYDYTADTFVLSTLYAAAASGGGVTEGAAVAVTATTTSSSIMYPFAGGGYYSLQGFPMFQGEGVDQGFTSGWIYDATVLSSSTNVNPQNVSECSAGFQASQFASSRDVQSKSGASLSIDVYNSLFGLNSDFQNSNSYFENEGFVSWSYNQICQVMKVGLTFDVCDAQLSTNFVAALQTLAGTLKDTDKLNENIGQSFLPTFGARAGFASAGPSASLGGFVWSGYASSTQNLTAMKSKGFDFDVSTGYAACKSQSGAGVNNTAGSLMNEYGVQGTYTISPGYPPIPFNEGGGTIDTASWYNALFTQLTPGDLTAITSQTAEISTVLQCPSSSALVTVLQGFVEDCGPPGSTCPVSEPFSYCSPGYYATAGAGSATPDCQPCFGGTPTGGDGCNPFTTAYCNGPDICTCDCGYSGKTCEDVCWWGSCVSDPKGTSCETNPSENQCQAGAPYPYALKKDGNCECECCETSVYKDDECATGNTCSASDISLPLAPYLEACDPAGCSMTNEWVLTCTNCTGLAAGANVTLSTCDCGVPSSIQFCTAAGGSFPYLACGACTL